MELSVKRMSLSSCRTLTPLSLLKVAFVPSVDCMSPPAVYIQLVKCQPPWLPVLVSAKPNTDELVSALAAARKSAQDVGGLSGSSPAALNMLRLYRMPSVYPLVGRP